MASTPYPLPRQTRETATLVGNGTAGPYGPTAFKVFDVADIVVVAKPLGAEFFAVAAGVTVVKTSGLDLDTVSVTFPGVVPATTSFIIRAARIHERSLAVTRGGALDAPQIEKELSKQGSVLSELRRDNNRAVKPDDGLPMQIHRGTVGQTLMFDDDGNMVPAPTPAETIGQAEAARDIAVGAAGTATGQAGIATGAAGTATGQAGIATTKAGEASTSETNASNSASAAGTSATNAQTARTGAETARDQAATMIAAFLFNTVAAGGASDPGPGNLKPNNATLASITTLYVDNVDATGVNVGAVLDDFGLGTSGVKSKLTLRKVGAPTVRHHFSVTAVTDSTGYRTLAVTYVGGAGALVLGTDQVALMFVVNGDKGDAGLGGGDVDGPASSVADRIATFADATGKIIKDSGVLIGDLATKLNAAFTGTFSMAAGALARSALTNGSATSVIGRSANSGGAVNDIAAASNDTFLQRVSNALSWGGLTIGMVADGLLTYAKLATAAIATVAEWRSNTTSKLLTPNTVWSAMAEVALTDAATIAVDLATGFDFTVTIAGNRTLGNFTNVIPGQRGRIRVVQDGTGGRTLAKNTNHKTAGGAALAIASAASAETFVYYDCVSSTKVLLSNSPLAWS